MSWKKASIFISSTFNDMHAERDYLVKYVFPTLAERLEAHKIRLVDVDLRWGVSLADSQNNHTVLRCLENIDDCRPFFLCLIGQRRGWVPNDPLYIKHLSENGKNASNEISHLTLDKYYEVANLTGKYSVTEMEIEHALLSPMHNNISKSTPKPCNALFFERVNPFGSLTEADGFTSFHRDIYLNDAVRDYCDPAHADALQAEFKERILDKQPIYPYHCKWISKMKGGTTPELVKEHNGEEISKGRLYFSDSFKNDVIKKLEKLILENFDIHESISPPANRYETDMDQQELFVQIASESYIQRTEIEEKLDKYINSNSTEVLLLFAEGGLGKTTLLASYVNPENEKSLFHKKMGIYRFCGASDLTTDSYVLWDSICHQAGVEMPESPELLRQHIPQLLKKIASRGYRYIVIDSINQMQDDEIMLDWFPKELPKNLKIILSIKLTTENKNRICNNGLDLLPIGRLVDFVLKKDLIKQFLKRYLKVFDEEQINKICDNKASENPLFLKILLHELRFYGSFKQLEQEIFKYGASPKEAFICMLKRLQSEDYAYVPLEAYHSVSYIFGLLSQSRSGLSEEEFVHCFMQEFPNESKNPLLPSHVLETLRYYLRHVRPFVARRAGRTDFLYEEFKLASLEIYNKDLHLVLAKALYNTRPSECAYHARIAGNVTYLKELFSDLDFLQRYYLFDGAYNLLNETKRLESGIVPNEIDVFIRETASILAKNPNSASELFYKELSSEYKIQAANLCKAPWIKMDRVKHNIDMKKSLCVGATSILPLENNSCHIASHSKEAFFLVSSDNVQIIDMQNLQTISSFSIEVDGQIEKIFTSICGDFLVTVMHSGFWVYALTRDASGIVISANKRFYKECRRIRLGGACAYAVGSRLVYQNVENEIYFVALDDESEDIHLFETVLQYPLSGCFCIENIFYYIYKLKSDEYLVSTNTNVRLEISSNINEMVLYDGKLVILLNEKQILFTNIDLQEIEVIECDFIPKSGTLFREYLLITSENGQLYTMDTDKKITDYGMLSVGRWDKRNRVYGIEINRAFFLSDHRLAIIEETAKTNFTIVKAKVKNNGCELLYTDENQNLLFSSKKGVTIISRDILSQLSYGLTTLVSYRCDWADGAILHMGGGSDAEMITDKDKRIKIRAPHLDIIFDIVYAENPGLFVILYQDGKIMLVDMKGRTRQAETFKSSVRNYLLCECGDYFCVITRRRLAKNQFASNQASMYEETALALHDFKGRMVYEEHFIGADMPRITCVVYDRPMNMLYVIGGNIILRYSLNNGFIREKIAIKSILFSGFSGIAADKGLLYSADSNKICVTDVTTGQTVAKLPLHRSISSINSSSSGVTVVENNELVYLVGLEEYV